MILLLQYANTQMKIDSTLIIYIKQFKFKKLCISLDPTNTILDQK